MGLYTIAAAVLCIGRDAITPGRTGCLFPFAVLVSTLGDVRALFFI
jgi:hypothetical protein